MAGILENFDKKYGISKDLHRHFDDTQFQAQFFDNGNDVQLDKQGPNPNEWGLADYPTEMAKGIAEQFAGVGSSTLSGLNVLDPENNLATLADAISAATQAKVGKTKQFTASDVNPLEGGAYWYHPQGLPRDAVGLLGSMAALRLSEPVVSGVAKGAVDYFAPNTSDYLAVQSNLLGNKGSDILSKLPVIGSILSSNLAQNAITQAGWLGKLAKWTGEAMGANKMAELISEGGGAAEEVRKKGGNKADEAEAFAKTVAAELPMLTLTDKLEAYTFFKGIGKEGASKFLSGLAKTGAVQGYEEIMQNRAAKFGTGEGNLTDMVNPLTWDTEDAMAGLAGAFGAAGTQAAIRGLNKAFGGEGEAQGQPAPEQPTQGSTSDTPAPTGAAAEEQTIDTDKVTPKGARAFLENAQSEMAAGEEYNAITELLDTGSDEDIIAKATSMGYGKKETPVKQEQPAQPIEQPVEQPVEAPAQQEDWTTAQINDALDMIPAPVRARMLNEDGSVNWDKLNKTPDGQKALKNEAGIKLAIDAINGNEEARKQLTKIAGPKQRMLLLHAAQQQMVGQGNAQEQSQTPQQPVKQEQVKPEEEIKPVKQQVQQPAPQGDEHNAQIKEGTNVDQNQGVVPQSQQVKKPEASNNQGQGQNSQAKAVKPQATTVQQFKDALGDYIVDETGFNNDNTRSYVHKADDGKDVQRVASIAKTKDGKYSATKNTSDKVATPQVFDTLEEAEEFISGKKVKKQTAKAEAPKPEPKKEAKPEPKPAPKQEKDAPAADENGVVPFEKGMGEEAMKRRREENSKAVLAKADEIHLKQMNGKITAKEATDAVNELLKKYTKGKVKLVEDSTVAKLNEYKTFIKIQEKGAISGIFKQYQEKVNNYLAEAQKLIDSKEYDKNTRLAIAQCKSQIEGLLDRFVEDADDFKLKRLKQYDMVFIDAAKKVDKILEVFDTKAKEMADLKQFYEEYNTTFKQRMEKAFKEAEDLGKSPTDLRETIKGIYNDFSDKFKQFRKYEDNEMFPLAAPYAIERSKARTEERVKEYEKQYNEAHQQEQQREQQEQAPSAEPDAQEGGSNIGAYADSVLGEGFMANLKAQLAEQKKEETKGKKGKKEEEPTAADQAIENDIVEQQVADQVATNEVVFSEIEAAIDSIPNSKEQGAVRKFFDNHPDARNLVAERLKQGVELFKVPYKDKSGKDNSLYYVKEAGSDEHIKVSKAEATVMSKVGNIAIQETTKDTMNKAKKAKYVTEISEEEDWDYIDSLEADKKADARKINKGKEPTKQQLNNIQKEVNIVADFLTVEFAEGKGCPFDSTVKTWAEWVRKVALKGAQYHSEDALDTIFDTDKISLDQKTYLSEYFSYLYGKYKNKVEDKTRQKKDLEADMVEKTAQPVEVKQEPATTAEQKAKEEAKQRAADAIRAALANKKFKASQVNKEDLDNFDSNVIKQIINAGHIMINDVGEKIYDGWKNSMASIIDTLEDLTVGARNYAKRILDSVWDYLSSLPDKVSFAADKLYDTLTNIATSLDMALDLQSSGFSYRDAINLLKSSNQKVYNRFKDYLGAAFRAIERYPRKNDIGGDSNVDVRAPEQYAQGNSGRGNGNGLEANSGNTGRGNQMGSSQTAQGATDTRLSGGQVLPTGSTAVSGSGTAASGAQGNQQSGTQKSDDKTGVPRNSDSGRGTGTGKNGSTGNRGGLGQNRKKAQTEAKRQASDASGRTLSQLQFNKEPFKAADEKGIAKAVPTLMPEQLKDVVAIEKRLFKNNGKGMLVANGTGTGKTMTGLGEIYRFLQKGARKILIVVPSSNIRDNWVKDAAMVGLPESAFATITTGKVAPDAINIITYKAFSENKNLLNESWDLVVMDECQWISSGEKSDENDRTNTAQMLRAISGHERTGFEDYMQSKYRKEYREIKKLSDKLKKSRQKLNKIVGEGGALSQDANDLKANIKSMEDQQKALRRTLDLAEKRERKEYDRRLLARKEDTRVLLLSATPFAYANSIYYAEGLLFNYDKGNYEDYMVDMFGYEKKQNGTVRMQRVPGTTMLRPNYIMTEKWHDRLVNSGAMINRTLKVDQDYNRRFVKVNGGIGAEIDKGFEVLKDYRRGDLNEILAKRFDYHSYARLLESIKAQAAVPMIKEYLKQGKKVVLFHDYKSEEPLGHPFKLSDEELKDLTPEARREYDRFAKEHKELINLDITSVSSTDQILQEAFSNQIAFIKGGVSYDQRQQVVKTFNDDNSSLNIVSVVAEAGKEGISLHDTTGVHSRVLINIGMPTRPTSAIQIEGRIYRLGQKTNAQFRYLYTDTKMETKAFQESIGLRSRVAETLALGSDARNLDGSFAVGYLLSQQETGYFDASKDMDNAGGKLYDFMAREEFEKAMQQVYALAKDDENVDEGLKAKIAERLQEMEDERNAKKREEILTEQNEKKVLATIKEAVAGNKVTKVADGVYVVEFVGGVRNLWIDLNNSQAAILGQMTDEQKRRMLSAADIKGSGFELQGYYSRELNRNAGAVVDIVRLTEVATTHTLDHEIMHFVHNALLKTLEKQHLEKYFKMLLKKQIGEDAYNKLTEEERLARCEEMEADAYADFCKYDRKPKNMVERIFWKMQKWLAQFAEKFGIETPMGIYIRVRSGEMYGRRDAASPTETVTRYQAAGVNAKTADLNKLSVAEGMEKRGMTRERIFDETGWWRAEDGKWRFEIKDDISNIKSGELIFGEDDRMLLSNLYENKDLYKAYPQLKNIVVQLKSLKDDVGGYASKARNLIVINSNDIEEFESDVSNLKSKIIKAIKDNAKGVRGNINAYLAGKTISQEIDKAVRQSDSSFSEAAYTTALHRLQNIVKGLPEYTLQPDVKNEDYVNNALMFYNSKYNALELEMRLTLVHEIQHFVQGYENHGRGSGAGSARTTAQVREVARILKTSKYQNVTKASILYVRASYLPLDGNKFNAMQKEFDDIIAKMSDEEFREASRIVQAIGEASDAIFAKESLDYYFDFAGEREARQASSMARKNYIHEFFNSQSLQRYPWQHLDELRTGRVQLDFGELLKAENAIYGEEQPNGTIKFSIKPLDEVNGKGMPDDMKNVIDQANAFAEENDTEGGIVVKDTSMKEKDKQKVIGTIDAIFGSPSELAKKYPVFRAFYNIYQKAQDTQEKLRERWRKQFAEQIETLTSQQDLDDYNDLQLAGELEQKEYTAAELKAQGYNDRVIKAYTRTRQLIRNIWEKVNDAHRGLVYRTEKMGAKKLEELSKKPFVENIMVREVKIGVENTDAFQPLDKVKLNEKSKYEVKYGEPHVYKSSELLTQEQLDDLRSSPYANVTNVEEYVPKGVEGIVMYKATVERVAAPIGKIAGYLPHIYEQWMVLVQTKEGAVPVGSGKNMSEAVKVAEKLRAQMSEKVQFYVAPKLFNPSQVMGGEEADGTGANPSVTLTTEDFAKLEKSLQQNLTISVAEARQALKQVAKKESRSRFFGNIKHRKGRAGYNSDMINSLDRYISMASRYVALQPAKVKAVNLFERTFGSLLEDYSGEDSMAVAVRRYMHYCNGTPNFLEKWLTTQLNKWDWWNKHISSTYGDRTLMSLAGKINGTLSMSLLGCFNISSAVVGLTQLINTYGLIGGKYLGEGMAACKRMNIRDQRVLAEVGIPYNISLDTPSGFTKRRAGINSGSDASTFAKMRRMLNYAGNKGMFFFKQADKLTRNATTLGAYYEGINEKGMTHKQAIAYAKEVNRKANFDYGAADAAGIFQWTAGTGFGELALLFQKYPMKEWELMKSLIPFMGSGNKAQKARFWGAYFLMAGLSGIPAGDWWDELLEKLLGYKPSTAFKSYLFREFGDSPTTRTIAYGIGANVGVDISRRVGMANMIPSETSMWGYLLGPGGNIIPRMVTTAANGEFIKTIKTLNPAVGNLAEAVVNGYSTNSKGQINYIYNDTEKFFKSMGFRPVGESMERDLQSAVYLDKQSKKDTRQKLMMEMVRRRLDGETLTNADYKAMKEQGITGAQFQKAVKEAKMTALQRTRARMTKQQKRDFAGTIVMEDDE